MEEPPRAQSVMQIRQSHFQVRASHIFAKVKNRVGRRSVMKIEEQQPYKRQAVSMDHGSKPFMSQQQLLALGNSNTNGSANLNVNDTNSSQSASSSNSPSRHSHPLQTNPTLSINSENEPTLLPATDKSFGVPLNRDTVYQVSNNPATPVIPTLPSATPRATYTPSLATTVRHTPHLPAFTANPMNRLQMEGSARLSPSIITRPPPMPLLNLPTLPIPTAPDTSPSTRGAAHLRSVPALPARGPTDRDDDPDNENSGLGDSDEEDDDDDDSPPHDRDALSDDEEGDYLAVRFSRSSFGSRETVAPPPRLLPLAVTSPLDMSFLERQNGILPPGPSTAVPADPTPTGREGYDYFSSKPPEPHSPRTPTPRASEAASPRFVRQTPDIPPMMPTPGPSSRPGMYHLASRSMINILSPKEVIIPSPPSNVVASPKGKTRNTPPLIGHSPAPSYHQPHPAPAPPPVLRTRDDTLSPSIRRRRSMPTFNPSTAPPPYPSFQPHHTAPVQPREEEGREMLPCYSNSVYLRAIMPRKMEFSSPGVQAKDRKWRRVLCVLEGTAFRVYRCPASAAGVGLLGEWWEKKVGVGDASASTTSAPLQQKKRDMERPAKLDGEGSPATSPTVPPQQPAGCDDPRPISPTRNLKRQLAASLLHPTRPSGHSPAGSRSHSLSRSDATNAAGESSSTTSRTSISLARAVSRPDSNSGSGSSSGSGPGPGSSTTSSRTHAGSTVGSESIAVTIPARRTSTVSSPVSSISTSSHFMPLTAAPVPEPGPSDLLHSYTLQHAESGLGNDYLKRKNVIRVRMEGQQFLLQAYDVSSVVEWIEGFHAAANISLDLDERPMPKGPMFPRRRRRRARRPVDGSTNTRPQENGSTSNANT